jgi:hypothetical protein
VVVFSNVVFSILFNCIQVVWHFMCVVCKITYITVVSIFYLIGMIRGGL